MEPMYLSIQQKETGKQIKKLFMENGYTVKDVQSAMGFENPQAIYKWISGKSLPSLDNFVILSRLLHTSIEDILVIDGDIVRFMVKMRFKKEMSKEGSTYRIIFCKATGSSSIPRLYFYLTNDKIRYR